MPTYYRYIPEVTSPYGQFLSMDSNLQGYGDQLVPLEKDVQDGVAFRYVGRRAKPSTLHTVYGALTGATALLAQRAWMAVQGTLITIHDEFGRQWNNFVVLEVRVTAIRAVVSDTTLATRRVEADWVVQYPYWYG